MRFRTALSLAGTLAASLALAPAALATFPGDNGAIAFERGGDIWTVNPDGTGEKRLTTGVEHTDLAPEWTPDGVEIFFTRIGNQGTHIYRMKADGTGVAWVREGDGPQISGDGTQLAYHGQDPETGNEAVFYANRDGSNPRLLDEDSALTGVDDWAPTHSVILYTGRDHDSTFIGRSPAGIDAGYGLLHDDRHFHNNTPSWSPDGTRIAFATYPSGISGCDDRTCGGDPDVGIRVMDLGAGGLKVIHPGAGHSPAWSPDAKRIAFVLDTTIHVMGADGAGKRTLVAGADPDWQPLAKVPPPPPEPEIRTVTVPGPTVTVQAPAPPPILITETIVRTAKGETITRTVGGEVERCVIPAGRRKLTLTIRTTKAVRKGAAVKVTVDLATGRAKVARGKPYRARLH